MDRLVETQVRSDQLPGGINAALGWIASLDCRQATAVQHIAAESFPVVWSEQEFNYFLAHENRVCFGLFSSGPMESRLRAYFLGLLVHGDLDIISVATRVEDRRLGLAHRLLDHALLQPNVLRAFLEVETGNAAAMGLYQKRGFQLLGQRSAYYGPGRDAFLMRWRRETAPVPQSGLF